MKDGHAGTDGRSHWVDIYRHSNDSTLGGVTSIAKGARTALLVEPGWNGEIVDPTTIVLEIVRRDLFNNGATYVSCRPRGEKRHTSFGGNFVHTSDSRFHRNVCDYPIAVHDRIGG